MLKDCVKGNQIKLPQLGWVKFRKSRDIPDGFELKQARIVRRASGYFLMLSMQLDVNIPDVDFQGHSLGIDLGLDKFLATSDGELVERPRFLNQLHRKLKLLQRRLKNKQKGSNNRHKLNQKIARLHQKISETRKDWHFKLAHHLCDQAQSIFVEGIDFRSWGRGMLSKQCLDAAFGQFATILKWVGWKRDVFVGEVDRPSVEGTQGRATGNSWVGWLGTKVVALEFPRPTSGSQAPSLWDDCVGRGLNPRPTPSLFPLPSSLFPIYG